MLRRLVFIPLLLSVLALAPATAARGAHQGGRTYFPQAQDPADRAYRPRRLLIAGEGSFLVQAMHWSFWGRRFSAPTARFPCD